MQLTVLITNLILANRSGTEVVTEQLADGLRRAGHRPIVYSTSLGPQARAMRERGHMLVDRLANVPRIPDVIHGHHNVPTMAALTAFPNVPALFVAHSIVSSYDRPPIHPRLLRYFAVSDLVRERCVSDGIAAASVQLLRQSVDLDRFPQRPALPERPRRALALTKNTDHLPALEGACDALGVELEVVGPSTGHFTDHPEELLARSDLVFATGRGALEAAATGCAVVVCDSHGFAGLLTRDRTDAWCRLNLAVGLQTRPTTTANVKEAIEAYDPVDATAVATCIRQAASLESQVAQLLHIYADMRQECIDDPLMDAQASATFLEDYGPSFDPNRPWLALAKDVHGEFGPTDVERRLHEQIKYQGALQRAQVEEQTQTLLASRPQPESPTDENRLLERIDLLGAHLREAQGMHSKVMLATTQELSAEIRASVSPWTRLERKVRQAYRRIIPARAPAGSTPADLPADESDSGEQD